MVSQTKMDHALMLSCSLEDLRNRGVLCDFEVRVGGRTFPVHRSVLAACSKYFEGMLSNDMMEARQGFATFVELSAVGIESCIEFMYTGEVKVTLDSVRSIIEASHLIELNHLTDICLRYLRDNLNGETCLEALDVFRIYGSYDDISAAEEQLIDNLERVVRYETFRQIPKRDLIRYLRNTKVTTEIHWGAATIWMERNEYEENFFATTVDDLLKTKEVSLEFLTQNIWDYVAARSSPRLESLVIQALAGHVRTLNEELTLEICFKLLEITKVQEFDHRDFIKESVVKYLAENFEEAVKHGSFLNISRQTFLKILHSPSLFCLLQMTKWEAIITWVRKSDSRTPHLPKLMKEVDIEGLPSDYIDRNIKHDPLVKKSAECLDILYKVMFKRQSRDKVAGSEPASPSLLLVMMDFGCGSLVVLDLQNGHHNAIAKFPVIRPKVASINGSLYLLHDKDVYKFTKNRTWQRHATTSRDVSTSRILVTFQNKFYLVGEDETICYDPGQNKWTMHLPGCGFMVGFCAAASYNFIYAFEGSNNKRAKRFEPGLLKWTWIAEMGENRCGATAIEHRGKIVVAGGFNVPDSRLQYLDSVERYDPASDSWEFIACMNHKRGGFSLVTYGNHLYAVGGAGDDSGVRFERDTIEVYDAESNEWTIVTEMEKSRSLITSCVYDAGQNRK